MQILESPAHPPSESPPRTRFGRSAPARNNLRGHLVRGALRILCLLVADLTAVLIGWLSIQQMRRGTLGQSLEGVVESFLPLESVSGAQLSVALVIGSAIVGGYRAGDHWRDPVRTVSGAGFAVILTFYSDLWHGGVELVLLRGLVVWCLLGLGLVFVRGLGRVLRDWLGTVRFRRRVLEIRGEGSPEEPVDLGPEYQTMALVTDRMLPDDLDAMEDWLEGGVDTILVSGQLSSTSFGHLTDFALTHGCRLLSVPRSRELVAVDTRQLWLRGQPFLELTAPGLRASQLVVKRALDIVGAGLSLLLLIPLFLVIGIWIKLDSPGPVLFVQKRPGFRGQWFPMLKFRSMRQDAETVLKAEPEFYELFLQNDCKLPEDQDPRITLSGRLLRKTSIDELPQLINVLRGEMSLVGPRPLVGPELENYAGKVPALLSVKPGMTGLWQVTGRSSITFPERAQLDLEYVRTWSLLRDLWILIITPPVVLLQRGAH